MTKTIISKLMIIRNTFYSVALESSKLGFLAVERCLVWSFAQVRILQSRVALLDPAESAVHVLTTASDIAINTSLISLCFRVRQLQRSIDTQRIVSKNDQFRILSRRNGLFDHFGDHCNGGCCIQFGLIHHSWGKCIFCVLHTC